MKFTAVIVEDEYKVREVFIQLLQRYCEDIEIVGEADNITDGYSLIMLKKPTIVFLDIEMPGGNGFELLAKFDQIPFEVIFVTSYGHYAIKAIKFSALDYLLKPVMVSDLQLLEKKLKDQIEEKHHAKQYKLLQENLISPEAQQKLVINTKTKLEYISLNEIVYLKADGNYTSIHLTNNKYYVAKTLKEYETLLCNPESSFIRIHKTYIVNTAYIKHVNRGEEASVQLTNDVSLDISRRKKQELMDRIHYKPLPLAQNNNQ